MWAVGRMGGMGPPLQAALAGLWMARADATHAAAWTITLADLGFSLAPSSLPHRCPSLLLQSPSRCVCAAAANLPPPPPTSLLMFGATPMATSPARW